MTNESDVEQKLVWRLLSSPGPDGLGYSNAEIYTKANIKTFDLVKGQAKKVYRPDYIVLISGLPVLVVEAKHPDEELDEAIREARLYAAELNHLYPAGVNPCVRVVATNGKQFLTSPADTATVDLMLDFTDLTLGSQKYHQLLSMIGRPTMLKHANGLRLRLRKGDYRRPIHLLGGKSARNDEVGYNEFGSRISIDFVISSTPKPGKTGPMSLSRRMCPPVGGNTTPTRLTE